METVRRYSASQRWLHWIVVVLVLTQLCLGLSVSPLLLPKDEHLATILFDLHDGTGATIFVIMLIRAAVRLSKGAPPMPEGTPAWVRRLSGANHLLFYILLLAQPVIGYFNNGANGFPLSYYGLFDISSIIAKNDATADILAIVHGVVGLTIAALIVLHLLGVAYHTYSRRDRLLERMLGGRNRPRIRSHRVPASDR
jgi:cytochrome b561